jgi:hypothetical protein
VHVARFVALVKLVSAVSVRLFVHLVGQIAVPVAVLPKHVMKEQMIAPAQLM